MKRLLVSALVLVIIIYLIMQTTFGQIIRTGNLEQIAVHIQSYGWIAFLIAIAAMVIQTFFPVIPFVLLAGANVLAFGVWPGFFIGWIGAVLAALINFLVARYIGRDWAEKKIGHHSFMKKLNRYAETKGFMIILLSRFIPVMPSSMVNTAAGISSVSFQAFLFATLLGKGPVVFLESVLGHYLMNWEQYKGELFLIVLGLGLFMLGIHYVKKKKSTLLL
ncbi:TVP38/TMEM64 family protein [Aneurinibacillus sp. REN35]|uniref:TVP38/TMEM64 family protein n=1 Tax=Aneurinibacillus sp. REN35 TaxID=3237286 RepID=UPI00352821F7